MCQWLRSGIFARTVEYYTLSRHLRFASDGEHNRLCPYKHTKLYIKCLHFLQSKHVEIATPKPDTPITSTEI